MLEMSFWYAGEEKSRQREHSTFREVLSIWQKLGEEGVAREVREETGLQVVEATYLFSLPNTYLYSGFLVHTLDLFFYAGWQMIANCWQWMMW